MKPIEVSRADIFNALHTIEALYDHLKGKAYDADLTYALRTLQRLRTLLRT